MIETVKITAEQQNEFIIKDNVGFAQIANQINIQWFFK